jgi:hypothetical protein
MKGWAVAGVLLAAVASASPTQAIAAESFEFSAEHLPEVAMDNRFATLPLWTGDTTRAESWQLTVQGAFARTTSGGFTLDGPMVSTAAERQLNDRWSVRAFGFFDQLQFSGGNDRRPLDTQFTTTPLVLPAEALFTDLGGTYRNMGAGVAFNLNAGHGRLGEQQWVMGALYQRVELRDYRATYRVLGGPSAGASGLVDYSGTYTHLTPFVGLAFRGHFGSWSVTPHALAAYPVPRRGVVGRITGPGFDLSGDTEKVGNGKHFGDPSLTLGLDLTYEPRGLSFDLGSFVSQALIERTLHKGADQNWVISAYKRF